MPVGSHAARVRVPKLLRFLLTNLSFGVAAGVAFTTGLLFSNAAGLADLLAGDGEPALAKAMLYFMMALTFGSLAMGAAVMLLPWDDQGGDGGPAGGEDK